MSANLLERVTPGPWRADGLDIRVDDDAPVATANISRLRCSFNAELIALAPDHALLLWAMTSFKVMQSGDQIAILDGDGMVARDEDDGTPLRFKVKLDAAGCPLLTPVLREALRRAIGLETK